MCWLWEAWFTKCSPPLLQVPLWVYWWCCRCRKPRIHPVPGPSQQSRDERRGGQQHSRRSPTRSPWFLFSSDIYMEYSVNANSRHRSVRPLRREHRFPETQTAAFVKRIHCHVLTNDAHKAFLSHSPPSCPSLLWWPHSWICKQIRPHFCTLKRKKKINCGWADTNRFH